MPASPLVLPFSCTTCTDTRHIITGWCPSKSSLCVSVSGIAILTAKKFHITFFFCCYRNTKSTKKIQTTVTLVVWITWLSLHSSHVNLDHRVKNWKKNRYFIFRGFIAFFNLIFSPTPKPLQLTGHLYFFIAILAGAWSLFISSRELWLRSTRRLHRL